MHPRMVAGIAAILLLASATAYAVGKQVPSDPDAPPAAQERAVAGKPFSGSIRIRQKGGTLYYDFNVEAGKVTSGVCAHRNRKGVLYDVVGGWYDRERLMLLLQSRGRNLRDQWFAHAHQFQREGDDFNLEHTLFGFGKTMDSGIVFQPHVIDRIEERE